MRNQIDKKRFLEELRDLPLKTIVAKRLGIPKATLYRWMEGDPEFGRQVQKALSIGQESGCDLAEGGLWGAVLRKEPWAIKFFLESNSKRYHKPRSPMPKDNYRGVTNFTIVRAREEPPEEPQRIIE